MPDDIAQFADKVRVGRKPELSIAVQLQATATPDAPASKVDGLALFQPMEYRKEQVSGKQAVDGQGANSANI